MLEVSNRMEELAKELARDFEHPVLGVPTIACMTTINAGKSTNKFPDSCNATFDLRNTPGLTREIIDERTHRVLEGINCKIEMNELRLACGYTEPEDPIVKTVTKIVGKPALISKFSTDMLFFTVAGIPGLIYGPGTEHCIHQPNEFCEIDNLERCLGEYLRIVEEY
jgi:acetylornithine deacetylase